MHCQTWPTRLLKVEVNSTRLQCVDRASLEFYKRRPAASREELFTRRVRRMISRAVDEVNIILTANGHKEMPTFYKHYQ